MQVTNNLDNSSSSIIGFINTKYPEGITWDSPEADAYDVALVEQLESGNWTIEAFRGSDNQVVIAIKKA